MSSKAAATGFGRYLQAIRLEKRIALEKVSEETRIGLGTLKSIEQEKLEELPAEVFLKGFLRAYAAFVGADSSEVIRRYESQRDVSQKITISEQAPQMISTGSLWKFAVALAVLGMVMWLSIYGLNLWEHATHGANTQQPGPAAAMHTVAADLAGVNHIREI